MDVLEFHELVEQIVGRDKCADATITVSTVSVKAVVNWHNFHWEARYPRNSSKPFYQLVVRDLTKSYKGWQSRVAQEVA